MSDVVDPKKRSEMMAGIGGKDTKPELIIRKGLHAQGFRYRLHDRKLPGKPDLVFPQYKSVILINGCFWHGHGCHLFKWPSTRKGFWRDKINGTVDRDRRNKLALETDGWRILTIWECALKGKTRLSADDLILSAARWIICGAGHLELRGRQDVAS